MITALKMANENKLALITGEVTGILVLYHKVEIIHRYALCIYMYIFAALALKVTDKSQVQDKEMKHKLLNLIVTFRKMLRLTCNREQQLFQALHIIYRH